MNQAEFMTMMEAKEASIFPQSEQELREWWNITVPCCSSCHDDEAGGLSNMEEIHFPDGTWINVCCAVHAAYIARNISDDIRRNTQSCTTQ